MLIDEARWLGARLAELSDDELFPLVNLGSSTREFRERTQPHIAKYIFRPLESRAGVIHHVDIKLAPGVDLVGDVTEPGFQAQLRSLGVRSVLASNLLEHLEQRERVSKAMVDLLPPGGHLFLSGPKDFPHHPDPIDNRFRPDAAALAAEFPGTELLASEVIDAGNWRSWRAEERGGLTPGRIVARSLAPFYRPRAWRRTAVYVPYLVKHATAVAVVLQKEGHC